VPNVVEFGGFFTSPREEVIEQFCYCLVSGIVRYANSLRSKPAKYHSSKLRRLLGKMPQSLTELAGLADDYILIATTNQDQDYMRPFFEKFGFKILQNRVLNGATNNKITLYSRVVRKPEMLTLLREVTPEVARVLNEGGTMFPVATKLVNVITEVFAHDPE
jgi:hypothetical protein